MKRGRRLFLLAFIYCVVVIVLVIPLPSSVANLEPELEWMKSFGGTGDDWGFSVQIVDDGARAAKGHGASLIIRYELPR